MLQTLHNIQHKISRPMPMPWRSFQIQYTYSGGFKYKRTCLSKCLMSHLTLDKIKKKEPLCSFRELQKLQDLRIC
jgi:hypothetical protein